MPCSEHLLGGCSELSTKWMPGAKHSRAYWCWQEHREHVLYQWSCTGLGQVLLWYKWFFAQLLSLRQKCRKKNPVALCLIQTGNLLQALLLVPAYWGCCPLLFSSEDLHCWQICSTSSPVVYSDSMTCLQLPKLLMAVQGVLFYATQTQFWTHFHLQGRTGSYHRLVTV